MDNISDGGQPRPHSFSFVPAVGLGPLSSPAVALSLPIVLIISLVILYLQHINSILHGTPEWVQQVASKPWTNAQLKETYSRLEREPIDAQSCHQRGQLPPKLNRRYIVTGGSGLVGGHIVLQLLARGEPPEAIRIVDFQPPHRRDMLDSPARNVDFVRTDISSAQSTSNAFTKPWPSSAISQLPLTVFHTAAVIVPTDRSLLTYSFTESVNVRGTSHVLNQARAAGADTFISTSSGSISIHPIQIWVKPWHWLLEHFKGPQWPKYFAQVLDESDFSKPLRPHAEFFANYPFSKAKSERLVCASNSEDMRTGTIRPAHGVYGHPSDNIVGSPLHRGILPAWSYNIVQSCVHGQNVAVAHLHLEAVLAKSGSSSAPQAGRPFAVTDPNPPISYGQLWHLLETLSETPFRTIPIPPVIILLITYCIEAYRMALVRTPLLKIILPAITGDVRHLQPALFTVTTHLVASNEAASRNVEQGGIGYKGLITTLDGLCQELLEWNSEHRIRQKEDTARKWEKYTSSVHLATEIENLGAAVAAQKPI